MGDSFEKGRVDLIWVLLLFLSELVLDLLSLPRSCELGLDHGEVCTTFFQTFVEKLSFGFTPLLGGALLWVDQSV